MLWFNKKQKLPQESEKKCSSGYVSYLFSSFGDGITASALPPSTAYTLYDKIAPLQSVVSKVTEAVGDLPITLKEDGYSNEITKDHEVLTLLNNPSPTLTKKQFFENSALSLMLTRELWVVFRGGINKLPVEIVFIHPFDIVITQEADNIYPAKIYTNVPGDRKYYTRTLIKGRYRYIDSSGLNEIFPYISQERNTSSSGSFRGMSKVASIKDNLLSYASSIASNSAALKNSGRPSGIVSPKSDNMTEKQWEDLQMSLADASGSGNTGKIYLLPVGVEASFPQWAPKDMDYATLQHNVKVDVCNLFSVPLPMVSESGQTYSNVEMAELAFYDNAVKSVWSTLADALKRALSTRYDLSKYSIDYNELEIPSLRLRAIKNMKILAESNVVSTNEARSFGGYEPVQDGEDILIPMNKAPLSSVISAPNFTSGV